MKVTSVCLAVVSGILTGGIFMPAIAQVTSDGTTNTIVNPNGNNFTIINGIEKGNNLFHSFSNFSVPVGGSANFDLADTPNITTIFSRVTGGNISNIDGLIQTINSNNPVSLFLMNPTGIVFGSNASLNISGSFVGTTANSIKFGDGVEFSAVNASSLSLLTISAPIGLQMGQNPGAIVNQSQAPGGLFGFLAGLEVQAEQTLALVGGDVSIRGSGLTAPDGRIELGSVAGNSFVQITSTNPGWQFGYGQVQAFQDIRLSEGSMLVTDGNGGGSIQLQGKQIILHDGSLIYNHTLGSGNGGDITVRASETLELKGIDPYGYFLPSSIYAGTRKDSSGQGGNILIETPRLRLVEGGQIGTTIESTGNAGNLTVRAQNIELLGSSEYFVHPSGLYLNVQKKASGQGGNLIIKTDRLLLANGAEINAATRGKGNAANITIQAQDIDVVGSLGDSIYRDLLPTLIESAVEKNAMGSGGDLSIYTERLRIRDGARVSAETRGIGNAGTLLANATEAIEVTGTSSYGKFGSKLTTAVQTNAIGQGGNLIINTDVFSLTKGGQAITSTFGQGNAGKLNIRANLVDISGKSSDGQFISRLAATSNGASDAGSIALAVNGLAVQNGAEISVSGFSTGKTGNLDIRANSVELKNAGNLRADVNAGNQGNIAIDSRTLVMGNGSTITTNALSSANGGNITINSPIIVGIKNSDIIANASQGNGGNIYITTEGIIGLKYRNTLTPIEDPTNDITASSEFNVNGTVQINNISVDLNFGLVELPANVADPSQQIASRCSGSQGNSFVVTGRGGMPQNPSQQIASDGAWLDTRNISAYLKNREVTVRIPESPEVIMQATGWRRRSDGEIELIAPVGANVQPSLTCAAVSKSTLLGS